MADSYPLTIHTSTPLWSQFLSCTPGFLCMQGWRWSWIASAESTCMPLSIYPWAFPSSLSRVYVLKNFRTENDKSFRVIYKILHTPSSRGPVGGQTDSRTHRSLAFAWHRCRLPWPLSESITQIWEPVNLCFRRPIHFEVLPARVLHSPQEVEDRSAIDGDNRAIDGTTFVPTTAI